MNKKNIVLLALTCGVMYQDAGAMTAVLKEAAHQSDEAAKLVAKQNAKTFADQLAEQATKLKPVPPKPMVKVEKTFAEQLAEQATKLKPVPQKIVVKTADDAANVAQVAGKGGEDLAQQAQKATKPGIRQRAADLSEWAKETSGKVTQAIKDSGKTGWDGITGGLEKMKTKIVEIARAGDDAVENFSRRILTELKITENPQNIKRMKAAIYATAGSAVVGAGVGVGVAVHSKNKNKDQSKQEQDTQQPATQEQDTQQQDTQSGWKGFLYT